MDRIAALSAKRGRLALGALVSLAIALPAVSAFATAQDAPAPAGADAVAAAAAPAALSAEDVAKGRQLFADWSCGACHALADAGGAGSIGPSLDRNGSLSHGFVVDRVTNGQGMMPSFAGQIPDENIDLLGRYIVQAKK